MSVIGPEMVNEVVQYNSAGASRTQHGICVSASSARAFEYQFSDVLVQVGYSGSIYFEPCTITHAYAIISPVILSSPSFDALHLPDTLVFPVFVIDVGPVKIFLATYTSIRTCRHEF